jgi:hypothetical protein
MRVLALAKTLYRPALALGCVLALAGCKFSYVADPRQARSAEEVAAELLRMEVRMGEEVNSLSNFRINGFRPINDSNLVVTAGVHDHYLITLVQPCLDLPYTFTVGFQSRTSNVTNFDSIIVNTLHGRRETCRIDKIYRLDDAEPAAE